MEKGGREGKEEGEIILEFILVLDLYDSRLVL